MASRAGCVQATLVILLTVPQPLAGYAMFTHEELIDLVWADSIRPLLLKRFPGASEAALTRAHSFAYGGCVIQDLGYYPFGKTFFSDLAHYVRSGDFVTALLRNAKTMDELAFAIGALSHYVGDSVGHSEAVNTGTALTFPKLGKMYGPVVTYEQDPTAHVRTETGYDVAQIAWWRYAPHAYRETIGFRVSRAVLERAFHETYGLSVPSILGPPRSAIGSYRFAVRHVMPLFARATIVHVRSHLPPEVPNDALRQFLASAARTDYQQKWNGDHHPPGVQAHVLNVVIRLVPKIGILKILSIKAPTTQTEDLFVTSVNHAVQTLHDRLAELAANPQADLQLPNRDLDTGDRVHPGAYKLTDQTYAKLLARIAAQPVRTVPAGLQENVLAYYADPAAPISTKKKPKAWQKVQRELSVLQNRDGVATRYDSTR